MLSAATFAVGGTDVPKNDFHTGEQYGYLLRAGDDLGAISEFADGEHEMSIPDPIICDFSGDGIAESDEYVFQKSATPDFADCVTVTGVPFREYEYYNALLGEHFYWRGGADLETIAESPVHEVTVTGTAPRNLYVPGLTNVRDVGGYASSLAEGGVIRQGLYYRGGQIDDIKEDGIAVLVNDLGVRAEIDLRGYSRPGGYKKGLEYIEYYSAVIGMAEGDDLFSAYDYSAAFNAIAKAGKTPVYLHCIAGADRTGIVSFMLLTACGVDFHDAALDYLFTCFSTHGMRSLSTVTDWNERLGGYPGETKAEQAKSWIVSKGVSEETVEVIRETFVEGYRSEYLDNRPGDVNGDRKINSKDVITLMKAIVGIAGEGYRETLADVNCDGRVNSKDVIALMKQIVG